MVTTSDPHIPLMSSSDRMLEILRIPNTATKNVSIERVATQPKHGDVVYMRGGLVQYSVVQVRSVEILYGVDGREFNGVLVFAWRRVTHRDGKPDVIALEAIAVHAWPDLVRHGASMCYALEPEGERCAQ